jgi:hypothetical protein
MLWKEARDHEFGIQRVITHLIKTNDLAGLEFSLELGADVEVLLPAFDITGLDPPRQHRTLDLPLCSSPPIWKMFRWRVSY